MAYDYSQYGGVLVARQDKVLTITLNSPETLNAITRPMHTTMSRIWDDVNDDPDVHVVVLTGAGRAFSAGGNVIAMQKKIDDPDAGRQHPTASACPFDDGSVVPDVVTSRCASAR